ncbi:MAG: hypothetical protein WKF84_13280 [Pyrinomonadaceae bacterium]
MAAPAGAVIWLISNIQVGGASIANQLVGLLEPIGLLMGLNGVILVAYLVAIPANEIVVPTILMLTLNLAKSNLAQTGVSVGNGRQHANSSRAHRAWRMDIPYRH